MTQFGYVMLPGGTSELGEFVAPAINFNGSSSYITGNGFFPLTPTTGEEITVSIWLKPNFSGTSTVLAIPLRAHSAAMELKISLTYNYNSGSPTIQLSIYCLDNNSGLPTPNAFTTTVDSALTNSSWNHILFTAKSTTGNKDLQIWINDVKKSISSGSTTPPNAFTFLSSSTGVLGRAAVTASGNYYPGCMAEIVAHKNYYDFDSNGGADRRKFTSTGGKPVEIDIYDEGLTAYLSGDGSDFDYVYPASTYSTTRNNITDCADSPSD